METGSSEPTISERARRCLISFTECLGGMAALDPQRKSLIENEFARFSIWSSNIGIFASGRASMDDRLRGEPSIKRLVLGLLEVLQGRIKQYLHALNIINNPLLSDSDGRAAAAYTRLEKAVESMASEIALLYDLTRTIRRASRKANDVGKALSFRITDEEGNDVEKSLANHFAANIQDQFPDLSEVIRSRLAKAMVLRRRRIIYKRLGYSDDPIRIAQTTTQPTIQQPDHMQTDNIEIISQDTERPGAVTPLELIAPSRSKFMARSATPLASKSFQKAAAPSVVSQLKWMALESHEDYAFPPPPEQVSAATEVICPFCLVMLPIQEVKNEERWRDHVKTDLDPYVCLTENCDRPDELYKHREEWLRHIQKHSLRWHCTSKAHNSVFFDTRDDYISHMKSSHRKAVTDTQIDMLANRSLQLTGPLFKSCPLCGIEEQDGKGRLLEHIVGHLQSLALKSLPPIDYGNEQEDNFKKDKETYYKMKVEREIDPQYHTQDISTFLSIASVSVPEARLAIKSRYSSTESIVIGSEVLTSQQTSSQSGIIYVAQQPEDVDYTIDIQLEEPLPRSKVTSIKCQIVYDPGSDNCILINRTRDSLDLSNLQQLGSSRIMAINGMSIIQPGAWAIKLARGSSTIDSGFVFEILLRERRHTVAIAQVNDALQSQQIEDSERSTKRQKPNANFAMNVAPHASSSTIDWKQDARDIILTADNNTLLDLQDGDVATIHAPISTTTFQMESSPVRYKIKQVGKIFEQGTTKVSHCHHSLIPGGLAVKVLQHKNKSPRLLVQLSELWKQEKSILKRLNHRNIVSLKAFDGRLLALYLELLPLSLARGRDSPFESSDAIKILDDISSALTYLIAQNVVHNDIKPSNIAYSPERGAVLLDFAMASFSEEIRSGGSPWYVPPEHITDTKCYSKGDIWAFGITMLYILKKIKYPEDMAAAWNIHEIRITSSEARNQMATWLKLIDRVRKELDRANAMEYVVFRMLEYHPASRISVTRIQESLNNLG